MLSNVPAHMVIAAHVPGVKSCTRPYLNLQRPSLVAEVSTIQRVRSVRRVLRGAKPLLPYFSEVHVIIVLLDKCWHKLNVKHKSR